MASEPRYLCVTCLRCLACDLQSLFPCIVIGFYRGTIEGMYDEQSTFPHITKGFRVVGIYLYIDTFLTGDYLGIVERIYGLHSMFPHVINGLGSFSETY